MAYTFEQIFAADPSSPGNVAVNGVVTIFAPGDASKTPLPLTSVNGMALANPIEVNAQGFGPAFIAPIDRVAWEGGGYTGFLTSYDGLKDEAVAARQAAEDIRTEVQAPTDEAVDRGITRANIPAAVASGVRAEIQPLLAPTVQQIAASYVASQPAIVAAAAAAVDANPAISEIKGTLIPAAKWDRGPLVGTDLDAITTPGLYGVATYSGSKALTPALPVAALGAGSLEVTKPSPSYTVQRWSTTGATPNRTWQREGSSGVWTDFRPLEWAAGAVPNGTDWDAITAPGVYSLDSFTKTATMLNLPPTPTGFAGTVEVVPVTPGRVMQRAVEYGRNGVTWQRMQNTNGTFPAWGRPGWDSSPLPLGASLATLISDGRWRANTSAIATSILDLPPGVSQPFTLDVTTLSTTNKVYLQELTEWGASGPKTFKRLALGGAYPAWSKAEGAATEPISSRTQVSAIGDSLTEGGDAGGAWPSGASWPEKLSTLLPGVTVTNRGHSGDSSDEVLLRAGVLVVRFTVVGGSIPASGAVDLTTTQVLSIRDGRAIAGTLAGVFGNLRHTSGKDWTFTRAATGAAVSAAAKQVFTPSAAVSNTDTLIYWAGRNDISMPGDIMEPTQAEHLAANAARVMEWAAPRQKQVMIIGPTTGTHESAGSPGHAAIMEANRRLRELFPANYASAQDYMVNRALVDMGATPTAADVAARAAGEMPPSLIAPGDTLHFSQAAAANLAQNFVAPFLVGKGWV